ncbi:MULTISPECIES: hypothetical protein [Thermoactinomyces]|jgi:hypothetical protein|uniref:Uncharacterized protein n=1 Tax=Thermoactinomyces vulgaris TaxID=2026 RepID=A0ABS0QM30_THEVU|nr:MULTISPECIES: hypothetical protein [Thermoactinomyces]MBA4551531.1 hypothetical protein [Thermoactinomyces vulgaris]MBA4597768.1 hypothetical protein [Thermoactinomyces vulgaris]MBH8587186.1 hypothetical protein [Thermoactinomyces sp. CICC 10520]MBH8589809.1 hypothetical protein [Thermoactinomyces vulgaris]MCF6136099.1 hypothetical protein [Thermoactinomyces vulgaris]
MTKKWIKLAQVVLSLVSLLVISLHPAVSSAADDADVQAKLKSLVEANVLKPIPFKGNCTSIQFKVQVGSVFKLVDLPDTPLKVVVPYEIYWYPASDQALVNGKKVDQGVLDVKEDNETLFVKYDPRSNPNGAKGTYVLKVRLNINNEVIGKILIAKLVFNHDCGSDQPGAPDDPGSGQPNDPNNPDDPGNQDDPKNPGNGGDQPGDDNQKGGSKQPQGGKLPKTATSYGTGMMFGLGGILAGMVLLSVAMKRKSLLG